MECNIYFYDSQSHLFVWIALTNLCVCHREAWPINPSFIAIMILSVSNIEFASMHISDSSVPGPYNFHQRSIRLLSIIGCWHTTKWWWVCYSACVCIDPCIACIAPAAISWIKSGRTGWEWKATDIKQNLYAMQMDDNHIHNILCYIHAICLLASASYNSHLCTKCSKQIRHRRHKTRIAIYKWVFIRLILFMHV